MTKAIVIRAAGDAALTQQIVRGLESNEMRRLRAENRHYKRDREMLWESRLHAVKREYKGKIKCHGKVWRGFWGIVGMLILLRQERTA